MANYCVTFRIADKTVGGLTYANRRQSLIDNTRTDGLGFWDATTSFLLVGSYLSTNEFAQRACADLSETDDMVVVFDPSDMSMAHFGPVPEANVLDSFFRFVKKLP